MKILEFLTQPKKKNTKYKTTQTSEPNSQHQIFFTNIPSFFTAVFRYRGSGRVFVQPGPVVGGRQLELGAHHLPEKGTGEGEHI